MQPTCFVNTINALDNHWSPVVTPRQQELQYVSKSLFDGTCNCWWGGSQSLLSSSSSSSAATQSYFMMTIICLSLFSIISIIIITIILLAFLLLFIIMNNKFESHSRMTQVTWLTCRLFSCNQNLRAVNPEDNWMCVRISDNEHKQTSAIS